MPDRDKSNDQREQTINNFMLCPWVIPDEDESNQKGASKTQAQGFYNPRKAQGYQPTSLANRAKEKEEKKSPRGGNQPEKMIAQRRLSPKQGANRPSPKNGAQKNNAGKEKGKVGLDKIMEMEYPIWKEESIPDLINDDDDINLLADRGFETLLDYDESKEPQSL